MIKMTPLLLLSGCLLLAGPVQAGDAAAGKAKSETCADCHGENGKGDKDTPSIAGMSPEEFTKAMKEYQAGVRTKSKKMTKSANKVNDEDIADMAAYYATLPK
jgi:cytochrome c553